ncbi:lytic transglycosylase [Dankookia rubra]|uniref:Lytic transglycosylase n=1 Tax=Dankookia rubra TaxID=1442381 RepID=A0A4R5QFL5_9PROT|nr:lytic transglycosylase domain-containing protein [Dankookia rubra]TDH61237.1 lytic transglycosylase [Dankookia rubra]
MLDLPALYAECASDVHPVTMDLVVRHESGGNPLAIYDNTARRSYRPTDVDAAMDIIATMERLGHDFDLGLGQINRRNLPRLQLSARQALDPCTNLRAASLLLSSNYAAALRAGFSSGKAALDAALKMYNTGTFSRGDAYLARYYGRVPALSSAPAQAVVVRATTHGVAATSRPRNPFAGDTTIAMDE